MEIFMKILLINGSPHASGATKRALCECESELIRLGAECVWYEVGPMPRAACVACGVCSRGKGCVFTDISELASLISAQDGIIIGTPTYYGGAVGTLTSLLSRVCRSSPEALFCKTVGAIAVGRRGGVHGAVRDVLRHFEFTSSIIVSASYPAIAYGANEKSIEYDAEGLQNMRSLAKMIFHATTAKDIAKSSGLALPMLEKKIKTNIGS